MPFCLILCVKEFQQIACDILVISLDVGEELVQPLADIDLCQFVAFHKGVEDISVLSCIMVPVEEIALVSKARGLTLFKVSHDALPEAFLAE